MAALPVVRIDSGIGPLMIHGARWVKPGRYGQYAETVDIAPTLAHLLNVHPPSGSEGKVLTPALTGRP